MKINILDINPNLGNGQDVSDALDEFAVAAKLVPHGQAQLGNSLYVPNGDYRMTRTFREDTQSGALRIKGESQWGVTFIADTAWTSGNPMFHLGRDDGHGSYRAHLSNFRIDGLDKAKGAIGLRMDQCGISTVSGVNFKNCDKLAWLRGCVSLTFKDKCQFEYANWGPIFEAYNGMSSNCSAIDEAWFSAIQQSALTVRNSGAFRATRNVFQSATIGGVENMIRFFSAHEGGVPLDGSGNPIFTGKYDGPVLADNWIEGGAYAYAAYFNNTRCARVTGNNLFGGTQADGSKEGGIFFRVSPDRYEAENSVTGTFNRTPGGDRTANYARYADTASPVGSLGVNHYALPSFQG